MSQKDGEKPRPVSQAEALTVFRNSIPLIINTPDGIQVMIQQIQGNLRAAIMGSVENMTKDQFLAYLASREGGINGVVRDVLTLIGVTQEIEPDSGVLREFRSGASPRDILANFRFPDTK